jgi:hypothetical protein
MNAIAGYEHNALLNHLKIQLFDRATAQHKGLMQD